MSFWFDSQYGNLSLSAVEPVSQGNKKPCLHRCKQGLEKRIFILPAYIESIQIITRTIPDNGQNHIKHITGVVLAMGGRFLD